MAFILLRLEECGETKGKAKTADKDLDVARSSGFCNNLPPSHESNVIDDVTTSSAICCFGTSRSTCRCRGIHRHRPDTLKRHSRRPTHDPMDEPSRRRQTNPHLRKRNQHFRSRRLQYPDNRPHNRCCSFVPPPPPSFSIPILTRKNTDDELGSSYTWIPTSGHDPDPRSFSIEMRDEDPSSNVFSPRFLMKSNGTSSTRPSTSPSSLPAPHPFDSSNDDGGYPTSAKVGIGVGVTVGLLLVAAIFAFVWWCGKRKRRMRREGMRGMRLVEMERGRKVEVSGLRAGSRSDLNIPRGNSANCYS